MFFEQAVRPGQMGDLERFTLPSPGRALSASPLLFETAASLSPYPLPHELLFLLFEMVLLPSPFHRYLLCGRESVFTVSTDIRLSADIRVCVCFLCDRASFGVRLIKRSRATLPAPSRRSARLEITKKVAR